MTSPTQAGPDMRNLIVAIVLATAIMLGWQYFYERPRQQLRISEQLVQAHAQQEKAKAATAEQAPAQVKPETVTTASGPRIAINSPALHGSLALPGARFEELPPAQYRKTADPDSPEVKLLARSGTSDAYFAEIGVLPG